MKTLLKHVGVAVTLAAAAITASTAHAQKIVVGGKNFTEQQLLAEMTAQYLSNSGMTIDKRVGLGSTALRQAQEAGQIDLYWEYVGTSLIVYNKINERMSARDSWEKVRELDAAKGLVWLPPSKANNSYALAMRRADAAERGIATISDMARRVNSPENAQKPVKFGVNSEWYARSDGLRPLQALYGFEFGRANVVRMDTGLIYPALRDGQVDVGLVFVTDGRVPAFDFVILQDDKGHFPDYAITPVIRQTTLTAYPELEGLLNALAAKLDDAVMARLNAAVDLEKKSVEAVAREFLAAQAW